MIRKNQIHFYVINCENTVIFLEKEIHLNIK